MLTVSEDEDDLFTAIKAGAQGYLLKNLEAAQLRSMLAAVARGEAAISPATAARIIAEFAAAPTGRHRRAARTGPADGPRGRGAAARHGRGCGTRRLAPGSGSPRTRPSSTLRTSSRSSTRRAAPSSPHGPSAKDSSRLTDPGPRPRVAARQAGPGDRDVATARGRDGRRTALSDRPGTASRPVRTVARPATAECVAIGASAAARTHLLRRRRMGYRITSTRGLLQLRRLHGRLPGASARHVRARTRRRGGRQRGSLPLRWMMEYPTQVAECIGCANLRARVPVEVVLSHAVTGSTPLAPEAGSPYAARARHGAGRLHPRSEATREALKPDHPSPSAPFFAWRTSERPESWQVWRSMVDGDRDPHAPCQAACPAGTDAGRYVGLVAPGRYDDAYAVAAEVNPFPSVCGWICTAPARPRAAGARSTSRSRSAASSVSRPSTASSRRSRRRRSAVRSASRSSVADPPACRPRTTWPAWGTGDRVRGDAGAGRHDGDRHPGVPAAARGPPRGDRRGSSGWA